MNSYAGSLLVVGGPHPGYLILGFGLNSGNGAVKKEAGVSVSVTAFNGVDNHFAIPLTVGQGLAWDEWHEVELVVHQGEDRYVSLRVDGAEQDLSGYQPPRSYYEGAWLRGQWIDAVHAEIVPVDNFGAETDDEVWWDDVSVTVDCGLALQSDLNGDCRVNVLDLAVMAGEWLMGP